MEYPKLFATILSDSLQKRLVDFNILGLSGLGYENVGEKDCNGEKNDDDDQALAQPSLGPAHPRDAAVLLLLGAHRGTI